MNKKENDIYCKVENSKEVKDLKAKAELDWVVSGEMRFIGEYQYPM